MYVCVIVDLFTSFEVFNIFNYFYLFVFYAERDSDLVLPYTHSKRLLALSVDNSLISRHT